MKLNQILQDLQMISEAGDMDSELHLVLRVELTSGLSLAFYRIPHAHQIVSAIMERDTD